MSEIMRRKSKRVQTYRFPQEWEAVRSFLDKKYPGMRLKDHMIDRHVWLEGCKAMGVRLPKVEGR